MFTAKLATPYGHAYTCVLKALLKLTFKGGMGGVCIEGAPNGSNRRV